MDLGILTGLIAGFGLIAGAMLITRGGSPVQFADLASLLITLGGAFCATLVRFPLRNVIAVPRAMRLAMQPRPWSPRGIAETFRRYAEVARRNGLLALESAATEIRDPFLQRGIQLAVDGTDPRELEELLRTEIEQTVRRHERGIEVLRAMAAYAPAFGMIGTLVGLVIMLHNLGSPETLGPAMGVAIVTTFYGAVLAYLVFGPIAEKLSLYSREEETAREMILRGILALQQGDAPQLVEQKLAAYVASGTSP